MENYNKLNYKEKDSKNKLVKTSKEDDTIYTDYEYKVQMLKERDEEKLKENKIEKLKNAS